MAHGLLVRSATDDYLALPSTTTMRMRPFLLPLLLLFTAPLLAQDSEDPVEDTLNMVPNGSFEEVEGKLKRLGGIEMAKGWKSPTAVPADLFSDRVVNGPASAPRNQYGDQGSLTGSNYAGILWWSYMNKEPRSYLQVKFKKMLTKGQKYCISYYVSLADLSKYSANELGAYVSKMMVKKDDEAGLTYDMQVPNLRTKVYGDLYSWQGVCGVYEAKGDEQYLIIGNTVANDKVVTGKVKRPKGETRPQVFKAYYYIDDVSVKPVKLLSECTCEQLDKAESEFIYSKRSTVNKSLTPAQQADATVIYFKRFQQSIDGAMDQPLNDVIEALKADPAVKVRLVGHMDVVEDDRTRMRPDLLELGKMRADAVKAVLVEGGIAADRITTVGQKADSPADPNEDEVALSKNRRVEFELE